jgi:hypothetical protein
MSLRGNRPTPYVLGAEISLTAPEATRTRLASIARRPGPTSALRRNFPVPGSPGCGEKGIDERSSTSQSHHRPPITRRTNDRFRSSFCPSALLPFTAVRRHGLASDPARLCMMSTKPPTRKAQHLTQESLLRQIPKRRYHSRTAIRVPPSGSHCRNFWLSRVGDDRACSRNAGPLKATSAVFTNGLQGC